MGKPEQQDGFLSHQEIVDIEDDRTIEYTMQTQGAWKGKRVRLRSIKADERDIFESRCFLASERGEPFGMRAELVGKCLVDGNGDRLFAENQIHLLGAKSGDALDELFHVCKKHNAMNVAQMEALAKKSEGPSDSN
jgi:hypothetical protein